MLNIAYKNQVMIETNKLQELRKMKKHFSLEKLPALEQEILVQEKRLFDCCSDIIKLIKDNKLIENNKDIHSKIYYIKLLGDYNRYIAEYSKSLKDIIFDQETNLEKKVITKTFKEA